MNGPSTHEESGSTPPPRADLGLSGSPGTPDYTETPVIDRIPRLTSRKKKRKPPRPTRETPRTQLLLPTTRSGWLKVAGLALSALIVVSAALFGLRLISESGCIEFTTERTTVATDGLQVQVSPKDLIGSFGVRLGTMSLAEFTANSRNRDVQAALAGLPAALTPASNPVTVRSCSVDPKLATLRMSVPPGTEPNASLDLYGWDNQTGTWMWLGSERDAANNEVVARVSRVPSLLVMMKVAPIPRTLGVELPPASSTADAALSAVPSSTSEVNATGVYLGDKGSLVGDFTRLMRPTDVNGKPVQTIPVVRNWGNKRGAANLTLLRYMLTNEAARTAHIGHLLNLVETGNFGGLEIDYRGVDAELRAPFTQFIEALSARLAERGKSLSVVVPAPNDAAAFDSPGYDVHRIGRAASVVKLDLSLNPAALGEDRLDALVNWATGQVNRHKLQVIVPTLSIRQDANGRTTLIGLEEALTNLGTLQAGAPAAPPGSDIRLGWSGKVDAADVHYSPVGKIFAYSYVDERGIQQSVWLRTTASLKHTLERLGQHNIRGITLRGLTQPGNDDGLAQVVDGFMQGNLAAVPVAEPVIKVIFGTGTPFSLPLNEHPAAFIVPAPGGEGRYDVQAVFQSGRPIVLGHTQLAVSRDASADGGATTITASALATATMSTAQTSQTSPAPVQAPVAPGVNAEVFELGGHVNDLAHTAQMRSAGMTWVRTEARKFDLPDAFITAAKAKGFKVLVTAVGERARVMDTAYRDEWAQHLGRLAAAGADAIEVWSEPNYEAEWPRGQINGANYADLLKRAYFAIKQANPNTLVISAGLAQTAGIYSGGCDAQGCDEAAFLNQMASADAKDYMDCIGIHYTSGFQAPSTVGTLHYTQYFEPLRNAYYAAFNATKPVCFTALGYITPEGFSDPLPADYAFAAGTTLADHAAWLAEAAQLSKSSGKVRLMIVWNVDSKTWRLDNPSANMAGDPQAGYAMIRPDGTCPACESLRSVMR